MTIKLNDADETALKLIIIGVIEQHLKGDDIQNIITNTLEKIKGVLDNE